MLKARRKERKKKQGEEDGPNLVCFLSDDGQEQWRDTEASSNEHFLTVGSGRVI